MLARIALCVALLPALLAAQQPELPRFRAGTNLVRVDAYVSKDDVAIEDLKIEDFEVYEDDKLQAIENFELVKARPPNPQPERVDPTTVRDMESQITGAARVFTLYLDEMRVSLAGSYRAQKPIVDVLDRMIGPDDLIGVMTPQTPPSSVTYGRRTSSIERMITDNWIWGKRDQPIASFPRTPQEHELWDCYGEQIATPFIFRLREASTLEALDGLIEHLDGLRPERKFVLIFTEGWSLYPPDPRLMETIVAIGGDRLGTDPRTGGLRRPNSPDPQTGLTASLDRCNRLATRLAYSDHEFEFRELLQRANRANVSFYPIDARGLVVFDTPINWGVPGSVDAANLTDRYSDLRMMAEQTDGEVVLDTNDVSRALRKILSDIGSYYLLSYYSTNQKLDGRFRRIRIEVKRDGLNVRARPGYLAPTEAEARAAGAMMTSTANNNVLPPTVTRALDSLAPTRGNMPVRMQAAGAPGTIRAVVELDRATVKQSEWLSGGTLKVTFEPERLAGVSASGPSQIVTVPIEPGQRSIPIEGTEQPLAAGRYTVRAELLTRNSRSPVQVTTFATVPADDAAVGTGALALRRGPSTGLAYIPTADPRFRRTERLRVEVPVVGDGFTGAGRLLTREGKPLEVVVTYTARVDGAGRHFAVADATLAPLAAGEYVLELSLTKDGKTESVAYGFRLVP